MSGLVDPSGALDLGSIDGLELDCGCTVTVVDVSGVVIVDRCDDHNRADLTTVAI